MFDFKNWFISITKPFSAYPKDYFYHKTKHIILTLWGMYKGNFWIVGWMYRGR
jgi:hypothetical protein